MNCITIILKLGRLKRKTTSIGDKINDRFNFQGYYNKTEHCLM
jgi:hypothetical protein